MNAIDEASTAAVEAIEKFMATLNARDDAALYDLLHLPHVRISGEGVAIWHDRADLEATYLRDFYARASPDWHHTTLDSTEVIHSSARKVHVLIQFTRRDASGGAIATYRSLWIMTDNNGCWGAQARSSFAP
ncbi:MAG: hypothetical protein OXL37_18835 [Chloroflexota bacterium]|nr:hypothetical protein [Chloroflexota bacterium]MDE2959958.1 hypothetical protein [Chloroflexota bacterium]